MAARFLGILVVVWLGAASAHAAGTERVGLHVGDADPEAEGWDRIVVGPIAEADAFIQTFGIPHDQVLYPVWAIDDATSLASQSYGVGATGQQAANALAAGFTVRWWFRIVPQLGPIEPTKGLAELRIGPLLYPGVGLRILFGTTDPAVGSSDLRMLLLGQPEIVIPGGSVYHLVEVVYDPVSERFDVFIDGQLQVADLFPGPLDGQDLVFTFGGLGPGARGQVNTLYADFELEVPDCDDGLDNDADGLTDLTDPGCIAGEDLSEVDDFGCNDGLDDDGDGLVDLADPGCSGPGDDLEFTFGPGASSWFVDLELGFELAEPSSLAPLTVAGTGLARLEVAPPGTAFLGLPSLAGTVNGPGTTGNGIIEAQELMATLPPATFAVATSGPTNRMPVLGERRLCLLTADCATVFTFPPFAPEPGATLGVTGDWNPGFTGSSGTYTLHFAPWTLGSTTITVVDPPDPTLPVVRHGFAHGPLSATSTFGATSGVVQLVTPLRVDQTFIGTPDETGAFVRVTARFLPEPSSFALFGGGAALAWWLGRRRSARGRAAL